MKIVVYRHVMEESNPWLDAFADGLKRHGIEPVRASYTASVEADLVVLYGIKQKDITDQQVRAGRHFLVMEMGYAGDRYAQQSLRFDGLNGRGWCPPATDGGERWRRQFGHLMQPWRDRGGEYVLLVGQVPNDQATKGVDLGLWYNRMVKEFAVVWPGLPVVFRPHPHPNAVKIRVPLVPSLHGPIEEALERAAVVVTYNSNVGVLAALAGVPVVALDQGSMAWPVAAHGLGELVRPERDVWSADLAWSQFTIEEMASGLAWEHLATGLKAV